MKKLPSNCVCGSPAEFVLYQSAVNYHAKVAGLSVPRVARCGRCLPPDIERVSSFAFVVKRPLVPWSLPYGQKVTRS